MKEREDSKDLNLNTYESKKGREEGSPGWSEIVLFLQSLSESSIQTDFC